MENKIFSLKNIIPVSTILLGIITLTQPKIGNVELKQDQIILIMLTLIATEFFIDKVTNFNALAVEIQFLKKYITGRTTVTDALKLRKDFDRMENIINEASKEVTIVGTNLQTVVEIIHTIKERLEDGINFEFFALNPNGKVIKAIYTDEGILAKKKSSIEQNLSLIEESLKGKTNYSIQMVDELVTYGCICLDKSTNKSQLIFQHNLNGIPSELCPYVVINKSDTRWNKTYSESIAHLKKHSINYSGNGKTA
jgi:hypothetical protein